MIITRIEPVSKTRVRIFLDEKPAFCLYQGEVSRYHLVPGEFLSGETYEKICEETLLKRAKLRAMHLLNQMGRTEKQLRDKLLQGGYPEEVTRAAIAYVKSFGYINDLEYAKSFILGRKEKKSIREIRGMLLEKGVPEDLLEQAVGECYEKEDSQAAIRELLRKKHYDPENAGPEETRKVLGYLMRKGFRYEDIRQVIQVSKWNA